MPFTLSDVARKFVLHWGEMGSAWGINRSVAQIHALLFFHGEPMNAEQISETLGIARSNVSTSLKELQNWKLVGTTTVLGDRRDYFETSLDVWALLRAVVRERKEREFDPTVRALAAMVTMPGFDRERPDVQDRVRDCIRHLVERCESQAWSGAARAAASASEGVAGRVVAGIVLSTGNTTIRGHLCGGLQPFGPGE